MLLQTDRYLTQGTSTVSAPLATADPEPSFSDRCGRDPSEGERIPADSRLLSPVKWLVGLQFHTANCQTVWLYYVVDKAFDTTDALRRAIQRADSDPERIAQVRIQAEADQVEVQQVLRDTLGRFRLTRSR
ncbi:hypothetical protein AB0H18_36920 [Streptomyces sp. NPDC020766]|uniref:hypothetical protein n=1 Tax=Streptomyces sp. NPDC020766 TaxID=3155011 RepID=UPI00340D1530